MNDLSKLSELQLRSFFNVVHVIVAQLPEDTSAKRLYTKIKEWLCKCKDLPSDLICQFYIDASQTEFHLHHYDFALEYTSQALWLIEKEKLPLNKEGLLKQGDELEEILTQKYLLCLADLKELDLTQLSGILIDSIKKLDPIVTDCLSRNDGPKVEAYYSLLGPYIKEFHTRIKNELFKTFQHSLELFQANVDLLQPLVKRLIQHQRWDDALTCYYCITDCVDERKPAFADTEFDLLPIKERIDFICEQKIKKKSIVISEGIKSPGLWQTHRQQLHDYRQQLLEKINMRGANVLHEQKAFSQHICTLLKNLIKDFTGRLGEINEGWSLCAIGSLARGDMSPCSDVEVMIIGSDQKAEKDPYLKSILDYLQMQLKLMGEPHGFALDRSTCYTNTIEGFLIAYGSSQIENPLMPEMHALRRPLPIYANKSR